jgi:IS5 family transposase
MTFTVRALTPTFRDQLKDDWDVELVPQGTAMRKTGMGTQGYAISSKTKDPDAAFAKRQGKPGSAYGYKAHVGVDQGSGLVRAVITTPANVNDTTAADELIRGDEAAVYADKAYDTHARRARLKQAGVKPRLMRRPNKHHALTPRQQRFNDLVARRRAAVETTFATWKRRMGLTRTRYVGLAKVAGQVLLTAMAFNLRRAAALTA